MFPLPTGAGYPYYGYNIRIVKAVERCKVHSRPCLLMEPTADTQSSSQKSEFSRGLGLFDSTMLVVGVMIGSGIFIVSAEMSRQIGSPGWLLVAWVIAGALTIAGALAYGELAGMMPHAGGMYVYLREAYGPLWGFLYGWTLFTVIQTGTIAAVAVAFARFSGVLWPGISEETYLISPIQISEHYAISLSTAQLLAIAIILILTFANTCGLQYGRLIQNIFTVAKTGALVALIFAGIFVGRNASALSENFHNFWLARNPVALSSGLDATTAFGLFVALCLSQTGSLFSADSWHNIAFAAGEVKQPERNVTRAMVIGTIIVITLYLLANLAYLMVLPFQGIQNAPTDRVGTATLQAIFPHVGAILMAAAIMVSTFGTVNALILTGARAYFAMAQQGLFFRFGGRLNRAKVPASALWIQGAWAIVLVVPRTYDSVLHKYGNLYGNLLDYVISAALIFYVLTAASVFRLRFTQPNAQRPYHMVGYPWIPAAYVLIALTILVVLFAYRPATTWPGLFIVGLGMPLYLLLQKRNRPEVEA
jgi:APA family basic amino acid/polyamine antiporter